MGDIQSQLPIKITDGVNTVTIASSALKVDPSSFTQPVSGTITAVPNGTQTVAGTVTNVPSGTQPISGTVATNADANVAPGTAPAKVLIGGMVYHTATPTPTNGQSLALQSDENGNLKVSGSLTTTPAGTQNVEGTVTVVPSGTQTVEGTVTVVPSGTATVVQDAGSTVTVVPSGTQTVEGTVTVVPSGTQTVEGTVTVVPSGTATVVQDAGSTITVVPSGTQTVEGTVTAIPSGTATVVQDAGSTITVVPSGTQTVEGTVTAIPSGTQAVSFDGGVVIIPEITGEVASYSFTETVAAASTGTLSYTVTTAKTLYWKGIIATSSGGPCKVIIDYGAGPTVVCVGFYSTTSPFLQINFPQPLIIAADTVCNIKIQNNNGTAQDVYGTFFGVEY